MRRESRAPWASRLGALPACWPMPYGLHRPLSAQEARSLDSAAQERFQVPQEALMERAALGVAAIVGLLVEPGAGQVLVLCGSGNNGGDGYVAARHLAGWGYAVRVLALSPPAPAGAAAQARRDCVLRAPVEDVGGELGVLEGALAQAVLSVDALFGVGLRRPLDARWQEIVARINGAPGLRLSVDLPSGMDADRGVGLPVCVRADVTATMAAPKRGLARGSPGAVHAGRVVEVDIGLPWPLHGPLRLAP